MCGCGGGRGRKRNSIAVNGWYSASAVGVIPLKKGICVEGVVVVMPD
jgi:hypothetical protein